MLLQPGACNLVGALSFLGDALAHLDQHALPLFDCRPTDICILDLESGLLKVVDWSGGFALVRGNVALLPVAWWTDPLGRSTLVSTLGTRRAAQMINAHVVGRHAAAVALAFEGCVWFFPSEAPATWTLVVSCDAASLWELPLLPTYKYKYIMLMCGFQRLNRNESLRAYFIPL